MSASRHTIESQIKRQNWTAPPGWWTPTGAGYGVLVLTGQQNGPHAKDREGCWHVFRHGRLKASGVEPTEREAQRAGRAEAERRMSRRAAR